MSTFFGFDGELLTFDAKTTEEYTEDAAVTEHPIESGGNVSDHVRLKPMTLVIEGIVSESPFEGQGRGILVEDVAGRRGLLALKYFRERRLKAFNWFSTRFGQVTRLMIESLETSVPNTQSTRFRLRLKQVSYASAAIVDLPPEYAPPSVPPLKECSEQPTTDATDIANDNRPASIIRITDDFLGDAMSRVKTGSLEFWQSQ